MQLKKLTPYLSLFFVALVAFMLYQSLATMDWSRVKSAFHGVPFDVFMTGLVFTFVSYFIVSNFDFLGVKIFRIPIKNYAKVIASAFICYVFNFNLGAIVGGVGFRYRVYTGWGVPKSKVHYIFLFSTLTNWSGYGLLLSLVLTLNPETLLGFINVPLWTIRTVGVLGFMCVLAYLDFCYQRTKFQFKGKRYIFPSFSVALIQLGLSCLQWCSLSLVIYYFFYSFNTPISYAQVLLTYLMASVVGLVVHVPGGLGVVETVFLTAGLSAAREEILVGLILFRIVYYLVPLSIALPGYLFLEYFQKKNHTTQNRQ